MINNEPNTATAQDSDFIDLDAYEKQCATFMEQYVDGCVELFTGETLDAYVSRMWAEAAEFLNAELNHGAEILKEQQKAVTPPKARHGAIIVKFNPEGIPEDLKRIGKFLPWAAVPDPKNPNKPQKKLRQCDKPEYAALWKESPESWKGFPEALAAFEQVKYRETGFGKNRGVVHGLGILARKEDGLIFIDPDGFRDPETGVIDPEAQEIIDQVRSYTEVSPSGKGLRIIGRGMLDRDIGSNASGVEIYGGNSGRWVTITGNHVEGTPAELADIPPDVIEWLVEKYGKKTNSAEKTSTGDMPELLDTSELPDIETIGLAPWALDEMQNGVSSSDRSSRCKAIAQALFEANLNPQQVLSHLVESEVMDVALAHRNNDPVGAAKWIWEHQVCKAFEAHQAKLALNEGDFEDIRTEEERKSASTDDQAAAVRALCESTYRDPDYPIDALGPLAALCRQVSDNAQLRAATVGQSILAAASLVTQGDNMVETLFGTKPLSLFALTIAESGDGKSTADDVLLKGIKDFEKTQHQRLESLRAANLAKPNAEQSSSLSSPYRLMKDATVEGIRRSFAEGWPSQGMFTAEGGTLIGGFGMSKDQRTNTTATLNSLWDGDTISVTRGSAGRIQLYDRRFCAHVMVQPSAVQQALNDPTLSSIGFWPRFLISWPEPLQARKFKLYDFKNDPLVTSFWTRCAELMEPAAPDNLEDTGAFKTIRLSDDARSLLVHFWERMELARDQGHHRHIKPFAVRATEQACRIAGVLAAFAGEDVISADLAKNAMRLAEYSLNVWAGVFGQREESAQDSNALELYNWLLKQKGKRASERYISRNASPKHLRPIEVRDSAIAVLQQQGLIKKAVDVVQGKVTIAHGEWVAIG